MDQVKPHAAVGPEGRYFGQLAAGVFQLQRCGSCARAVFFPRNICPHCGGGELQWFTPSGLGTVYAATCVRREARHGGDYNVVLVDLDEGVRLMSKVVSADVPDIVPIGTRVRAEIVRQGDAALVVFNVAEAA